MKISIAHQMPQNLSPIYAPPLQGAFDWYGMLKTAIIDPTLTAANVQTPVSISFIDDQGQTTPGDADDVLMLLTNCMGDAFNPDTEETMHSYFSQTLIRHNPQTALPINELFALQAGMAEKLPEPSSRVLYSAQTDIIPTCKEFLANIASGDKLFATFAYFARPKTLGAYFRDEKVFDEFKKYCANQAILFGSKLPAKTTTKLGQFQQLTLSELTESLLLRVDINDDIDEFSFSRMLLRMLLDFCAQTPPDQAGMMPFAVDELICPKTMVFVNVERHAYSSAKKIRDEWEMIQKALTNPPTVLSNNAIRQLTADARQAKKAGQQIAAYQALKGKDRSRSAISVSFKRKPPSTASLVKIINKISKKMGDVARSDNAYKYATPSFARANRRDPDNYNLKGKSVSTRYRPDIHIYMDTSASISEENYEDMVKACMLLAKKLDVNLYFNSFSDCMSACSKIQLRGKTMIQAYKAFQRIPKVTGGTDYAQIWDYIEASPTRQRELSIIITDFEWWPPKDYRKHPDNLYYVPCSKMDWDYIKREAKQFCRSMLHIDPSIRKRLLF